MVYCSKTGIVICGSAECDLMFIDLKKMTIVKQMAGYNDELFGACLVSEKSNFLAVANNSSNLIIYNLASSSCHLISGKGFYQFAIYKYNKNFKGMNKVF